MLEYAAPDCGETGPAATGPMFIRHRQNELDARHALDKLFRRERKDLIRYLERQVGRELAPDLAQDVFLRAATSQQIGSLGNPRAFLRRVANTVIIDRARRKKCRIATLPLIEAVDAACAADQEHGLAARDLKAMLETALAGLPERTRAVFMMHRFDHKAYREIHLELGISIAAVEYHMMRALAHIRVELAGLIGDI
jgi:RNA polymerase sigma-70 factor (ECF subfamily)